MFVVPEAVLAAVRDHAATAADGHEVGGWLVVRRDVATGYAPVVNLAATERGRFRTCWRSGRGFGESIILLHTHPGAASPSERDLSGSLGTTFAIYGATAGELRAFRREDDRASYQELPVRIAEIPPEVAAEVAAEAAVERLVAELRRFSESGPRRRRMTD